MAPCGGMTKARTPCQRNGRCKRHHPNDNAQLVILQENVFTRDSCEKGELTVEHIYAALRSLPTSEIALIVERVYPLLHLDPVTHLPPEITFEIFSHLTPKTLVRVMTLSKSWRACALDSTLWRLLFTQEGWFANMSQVRAFEGERRASLDERKACALFRRTRSISINPPVQPHLLLPSRFGNSKVNWKEVQATEELVRRPATSQVHR